MKATMYFIKNKPGAAIAVLLLLAGCGTNMLEFASDKNSAAATKENAQILIDSGDYGAAIAILAAFCPSLQCASEEDAKQLAAAYMGEAGLDVLDLIKNAETSADTNSDGSDFTLISSLLPSVNTTNFTNIDNAVQLLNNTSDRSDEAELQLAIAQLTSATIAIGLSGGGYDAATGEPISCGGDGCDAGETDFITDGITLAPNGEVLGTYVVDSINSAITSINSISSLATTDISDQMNNLAFDIQNSGGGCSSTGGTPIGDVTTADLENYITNCL